jgi:hypothetical protein
MRVVAAAGRQIPGATGRLSAVRRIIADSALELHPGLR